MTNCFSFLEFTKIATNVTRNQTHRNPSAMKMFFTEYTACDYWISYHEIY